MNQWLSCVAIPSSMVGLGPYDCLMIALDPDGYVESGVAIGVIISAWTNGEQVKCWSN